LKYVISERAKIDLAEIWYYSQTKWGIKQADKYLDQFYETFDFLTRNPKLGKQTLSKAYNYLRYRCEKHYIFYTIENDQKINIIRILHTKMNFVDHLE